MSDFGKPQILEAATYEPQLAQSDEDVAALFTTLKLQHGHYQRFTRRQTAKVLPQVHEAPLAQPVARIRTHIGVFSPAGGSGKTFLAAGIGSILCLKGRHVLLVDASPWPALAFHFGATEVRTGCRTFSAPGPKKTPMHLLSCEEGEASCPDITKLSMSLSPSTPPEYIVFDLSGVSGKRLLGYLSQCDRVLVPLLPDPSALRVAAAVVSLISSLGTAAPQLSFILNNMDDSDASRVVHEALVCSFGEELLPSVILHQPEVRKALQDGVVLPFYAPEAQASLILSDIVQTFSKPEKASIALSSRWIER